MPRIHTRRLGARRYADFSASALKAAATDVSSGMSYRKAEEKHGVPKDTIRREVLGLQRKPFGRPPVLSPEEEDEIARLLSTVGDWGYPLDSTDLKLFIKQYLDRSGRTEKRFKNNLPGADWCYSFLKRRKELTQRLCQNIKRSRAAISNTVIESYFTELEKTMDGIPPENIINYDESNLTDDPGVTKVIAKKGSKRISRILDHKKKRLSVPSGRSVKSADLVSSDSDSPDDEDIPDELVSSDDDIAQGSDSPDDTNMIIEDAPAETPCWMGINHFTPDCNTDEQFLLVKFFMNNGKSRFYLGKALGVAQGSSDGHGQCEVKFLRPYQTTSNTFVWPGAADITTVDLQQIVGIAEKPTVLRRGQLKFNVDSREWK